MFGCLHVCVFVCLFDETKQTNNQRNQTKPTKPQTHNQTNQTKPNETKPDGPMVSATANKQYEPNTTKHTNKQTNKPTLGFALFVWLFC